MSVRILLFALIILSCSTCKTNNAEKNIETFKWLIGFWEMKEGIGQLLNL